MRAVGRETVVGGGRRMVAGRLGRVDLLFGLVGDGEGMVSSHRHGCSLILHVW